MKEIAKKIRRTILTMANRSGAAHIGSCLSIVDILTILYFKTMKVQRDDNRDRFILSKGHAAMALYATLAEAGFIESKFLDGFFKDQGTLPAHLDKFSCNGIEVSAGSLGHGLPMGLGMAYGMKLRERSGRVFVLIGDGESQEGANWEAAMLAPRLHLDNLTVFMDYNNLQGYGSPKELFAFEPVCDKWKAFSWEVFQVDGHHHEDLLTAVNEPQTGPKIIICRTVKGKGISFMENKLKWHYWRLSDELYERALEELQ